MKFFEVNQIVWIFSCFLLSKIAYNQRKTKKRLIDYLKTKKRSKRKYSIYSDIKSGMSLDRKGFMELLNAVMAFKIKAVYISYKDRLARLSYELVEKLFSDYGTKIVIINQCESISLEQELFEDIMQTIHSFSMKMYSKRRIAKKLLLESKVNPALLKSLNGETDDLD
ncbi:recombinase family protein [Helicobacter pylori]|uniref:recombinase family protein n=1 Tax=Helicobacter pylori TaxID=210 RepID=UPI001E344218|nr:recombinase family protein [Helicobacter pylori]